MRSVIKYTINGFFSPLSTRRSSSKGFSGGVSIMYIAFHENAKYTHLDKDMESTWDLSGLWNKKEKKGGGEGKRKKIKKGKRRRWNQSAESISKVRGSTFYHRRPIFHSRGKEWRELLCSIWMTGSSKCYQNVHPYFLPSSLLCYLNSPVSTF